MTNIKSMVNSCRFVLLSSVIVLMVFSLICLLKGVSWFPDGPVLMIVEVTRSISNGGGLLPAAIDEQVKIAQALSRDNHTFVWQDMVSLNSKGALVPKHSILSSVMAVPFYLVFGDLGFWLLQQIFVLILVYSVHKLSSAIFEEVYPCSVLLGVFLMSQTIFYSYSYAHDLHGCALLLLGFAVMQERRISSSVLGPLVMALSVIIRPNYLVLVPLLSFIGDKDGTLERKVFSALGLSIGLLLVGFYNFHIWGNPVASPYSFVPAFNDGRQVLSYHPIGFSWRELTEDWWSKLFGLTGLVPVNLGFIFSPFVFIFCWKHRNSRFLLRIFSAFVFYICYVFSYEMWDVSALGNRFLFPAIYLYLVLLVGYLGQFERRWRSNSKAEGSLVIGKGP